MMKVIIGAVVLLVIVAGVLLLATPKSEGGSGTAHPANVNLDQNNTGVVVRPETHVFECGEPDYLEDTFTDKNGNKLVVLEKGESMEGTAIKFLHSPKWVNKCGLDEIKDKAGKLAGLAIYKFNVERDDTFYVFLRAKWTDTCGNSVWVLMDGPEKGGHGPEAGSYYSIEDQEGMKSEKDYAVAWHPLKQQGRLIPFKLAKGPHTIELHTREDGPRFDQLVVSTEGSVPVGVAKKK